MLSQFNSFRTTQNIPNINLYANNLKITKMNKPNKYKISWDLLETEYYHKISKKQKIITLPNLTSKQKESLTVHFGVVPILHKELYHKIVKVRYTDDGWITVTDTVNIKVKLYSMKDIEKGQNIVKEENEKISKLKKEREELQKLIDELSTH
jgi:hypothetical protein